MLVPHHCLKLINSYLTNRTIHIKYNRTLSLPFTPHAGVPQGSVIASTLYIAYTHDIPQPIDNFTHTFSYVDDVTLLTIGRPTTLIRRAQQFLNTITRYEETWEIKTNPNKTHFMVVGARDTIIQNERLFHLSHTLDRLPQRTQLHPTTHITFLGTTIDNFLRFTMHATRTTAKVRKAHRLQTGFLNTNTKTKTQLFTSCTLPLHLDLSSLRITP